jgi:hypothetical protein
VSAPLADGSKVRAEASKDGAAHVACGVFEGASMACGEMKDGHNYNFVSAGEPNAFRAYGCALPAEAEVPTRRWRASSCSWNAACVLPRRRGQSRCTPSLSYYRIYR